MDAKTEAEQEKFLEFLREHFKISKPKPDVSDLTRTLATMAMSKNIRLKPILNLDSDESVEEPLKPKRKAFSTRRLKARKRARAARAMEEQGSMDELREGEDSEEDAMHSGDDMHPNLSHRFGDAMDSSK